MTLTISNKLYAFRFICRNYLISVIGLKEEPRKKSIFTSEAAVQTENIVMEPMIRPRVVEDDEIEDHEDHDSGNTSQLTSSDLSAIIKWSSEISSDMNLFSCALQLRPVAMYTDYFPRYLALRRLTEIAVTISGAQSACIVMARGREYAVATSMAPPGKHYITDFSLLLTSFPHPAPCVVHECVDSHACVKTYSSCSAQKSQVDPHNHRSSAT